MYELERAAFFLIRRDPNYQGQSRTRRRKHRWNQGLPIPRAVHSGVQAPGFPSRCTVSPGICTASIRSQPGRMHHSWGPKLILLLSCVDLSAADGHDMQSQIRKHLISARGGGQFRACSASQFRFQGLFSVTQT